MDTSGYAGNNPDNVSNIFAGAGALENHRFSLNSTWQPSTHPLTYTNPNTVVIAQGDTLSKIIQDQKAKGNNITIDDLKGFNGLGASSEFNLQIGQNIVVPVKSGNNLSATIGNVSLTMDSTNGTYTYNIVDAASNTTTVYSRTFDVGTGQYTDLYTETNNANGAVINTITTPVDTSYGSQFNNGAATTNTFTCTITDPTDIGSTGATDPTVTPATDGIAATGGTWTVGTNAAVLNTNTDFYSAYVGDMLTGGIRPGNSVISNTSAQLTAINGNAALVVANTGQYDGPTGTYDMLLDGYQINLSNSSTYAQWVPADPLILDLNGDGIKLTSYQDKVVLFDIDHDGGTKEQTGWIAANTTTVAGGINTDGIVVYDLNGNGRIDDISETISEYFNGTVGTGGNAGTKAYANGFAALQSLDTNGNNQFESGDAAWNNIKIWVDDNADGNSFKDTNGNGMLDTGEESELKTLTEHGITGINLAQTVQSGLVNGGNEILATGSFVQNGMTKEAQAANFLANPFGQTLTTLANGTRIDSQTAGGSNAASYVSHLATGEVMNAAALGVANLTGNAGDDTLNGDANANWLMGSLGSDTFNADAGDDVLLIDAQDLQANIHAGEGFDMLQVVGTEGVTLNLAQAEVEVAIGGTGNDIFIGGGRNSVFVRGGILVAANDLEFGMRRVG